MRITSGRSNPPFRHFPPSTGGGFSQGVKCALCLRPRRGYSGRVKTVINLEETIGKTVGWRVPPRDPFAVAGDTKAVQRAWRKTFPTPFVPKGVYRFHTHEEADAWLMKMLTRPRRGIAAS